MARVSARRMVARREETVRHDDKEFTVAIESEDTMVASDADMLAVLGSITDGISEMQAAVARRVADADAARAAEDAEADADDHDRAEAEEGDAEAAEGAADGEEAEEAEESDESRASRSAFDAGVPD